MTVIYHVWDTQDKKYLKLAQNGYTRIGSTYTTYRGMLTAMAYRVNWPDNISNDKMPPWREPDLRIAFHEARDTWWDANKDRPFSELFGPRYELHTIGEP